MEKFFFFLFFLFTLIIMSIPILIDILIIKIINGYNYNLYYLIVFLTIYYILNNFLNILINKILNINKKSQIFKIKKFFNLILQIISGYMIITFLENIFVNINLFNITKIIITLINVFINNFIINNSLIKNNDNRVIDKLIQKEVCDILEKENIIICIKTIKNKYPNIQFHKIVKSIRRINKNKKNKYY